jgi:SAM-dependent methyltransferase
MNIKKEVTQMDREALKEHWEQVYSTRPTEKLGWYEPHLLTSFSWITGLSVAIDASIIDVGGGASTLADDLLNAGYRSITLLDISEKALSSIKARLGKKAELITWLEGDITSIDLPTQYYELWHDRAVFHFLTELEQQRKYRDNLLKALKPGGHLIIGTFAPDAPPKCSGLPVQRYSFKQLKSIFGGAFELKRHYKELHITPGGVEQMYLYCHFYRTD